MPRPFAVVHASYLAEVARWLDRHGVDVPALYTEVGLDSQRVGRDPDFFVPTRLVFRFVALAEQQTSMPDLGWRVGAEVDLDRLPAFVAARRARDLRALLVALVSELQSDSNRMLVWLRPVSDGAWFCFGLSLGGDSPGASFVEQHDLRLFLRSVQRWLPPAWQPRAIQLARTTGLARTALRARLPDVVLRSGSFAGFHIGHLELRTAVPHDSPPPPPLAHRVRAPQDLRASLRAALQAMLVPAGPVPIVRAAAALGVAPRTLQRRLAQTGTSYTNVLDDLRHDLALEWLAESRVPVAVVAQNLGYSHPAHFTRAFRRWEGVSPRAFRRASEE